MYKDLIGLTFGKLTPVEKIGTSKSRQVLWNCMCECGNTTIVASNHLQEGHTTSCGCYQRYVASKKHSYSLVGKVFGRLTVIGVSSKKVQRAKVWRCRCECGSVVDVHSTSLTRGHTKSCGCLHFDTVWKGGLSCEPYCTIWLDKEYKESIKIRDDYTCQNPDCWQTSTRLVLHHIDYNKKNCAPDNLITLCNSCNIRANSTRDYYTGFYQSLVGHK